MVLLRSLIFNILFFGWSLLASLIFIPLFVVSPRAAQKSGAPWAAGVLFLARLVCGIKYEIRGARPASDEPLIYAAKHQSAWDTAIFLLLLDRPAYILKRELLRIPFWGWYLWRMQMIAIDRSGGASSMKGMLRQAKAALEDGRPLVIYPEGTRTRPGATPHYHPGIAALYGLQTKVVPVALNSGCYWGKNAFVKRPGTIVIEFLPAIDPGLKRDAFMARLQETIETASQKLLEEAQSTVPPR